MTEAATNDTKKATKANGGKCHGDDGREGGHDEPPFRTRGFRKSHAASEEMISKGAAPWKSCSLSKKRPLTKLGRRKLNFKLKFEGFIYSKPVGDSPHFRESKRKITSVFGTGISEH